MAEQNRKTAQETSVDPEMLKNLDLLMNMDVVEQEAHWDDIENLEETEQMTDEELKDEA